MSTAAVPISSPDLHGASLTTERLDAGRYDTKSANPWEVTGMMQALMPTNSRVLDVGCGTGAVTVIANQGKGNVVVAIEPDAERAAIARSRGVEVHECFLDEDFIAANGPFDVVMSSDVLEHIPNPAGLLDLMKRAVRPGGVILLSVPNVAHWTVRLNLLIGQFDYAPVGIMDATHLRWFTAKSISELVKRCGLTLVEIRYAAGLGLPVYWNKYFKMLHRGALNRALRLGTRLFPRLFGVQFVLLIRTPAPAGAE